MLYNAHRNRAQKIFAKTRASLLGTLSDQVRDHGERARDASPEKLGFTVFPGGGLVHESALDSVPADMRVEKGAVVQGPLNLPHDAIAILRGRKGVGIRLEYAGADTD